MLGGWSWVEGGSQPASLLLFGPVRYPVLKEKEKRGKDGARSPEPDWLCPTRIKFPALLQLPGANLETGLRRVQQNPDQEIQETQ